MLVTISVREESPFICRDSVLIDPLPPGGPDQRARLESMGLGQGGQEDEPAYLLKHHHHQQCEEEFSG